MESFVCITSMPHAMLLSSPGKEIHFIEFGVGGGTSQAGDTPARTASEAAWYPYFGIFGAYRCVDRG